MWPAAERLNPSEPILIGVSDDTQFPKASMTQFVRLLPAMSWRSFLDLLEAALRREPPQPREAHLKRNAACRGIDHANPVR